MPENAAQSHTSGARFAGRFLLTETAIDYTTFIQNYTSSIGTAVPLTTIPPVVGISTVNLLGRPIASP
jgi:hypothetical protein